MNKQPEPIEQVEQWCRSSACQKSALPWIQTASEVLAIKVLRGIK